MERGFAGGGAGLLLAAQHHHGDLPTQPLDPPLPLNGALGCRGGGGLFEPPEEGGGTGNGAPTAWSTGKVAQGRGAGDTLHARRAAHSTPPRSTHCSFSSANLSETIEELKRFNALQKFRGTVQAVFAMNRMQKLLGAEMRQAARTIQRKWKSKAAGPGSPTSAPAPAAAVPEPEPEPPAPSETSTPGASEAVEGAGAPAASGAAPGSAADGPAGADYKTWKVDELRRALKQRGLPVGGLKHVLAKRLREDDEAQRSPKKARKS